MLPHFIFIRKCESSGKNMNMLYHCADFLVIFILKLSCTSKIYVKQMYISETHGMCGYNVPEVIIVYKVPL